MVKNIVKGKKIFLKKAKPARDTDKQVVTDLIDTLRANREICVGMAANMIGVNKSIIVVAAGPFQFAMINPVITKKSGEYQTEEGCLSLDGVRACTRYEEIEVDANIYTISGFPAFSHSSKIFRISSCLSSYK
jgi:peptide deformylase